MVIWLRKKQVDVGIPDGVVRRDAFMRLTALDDALLQVEELRASMLAEVEVMRQEVISAAHDLAAEIRLNAENEMQIRFEAARLEGLQSGIDEWNRMLLISGRDSHEQLRQQKERMAGIVLAAVEKIAPMQDPQGVYKKAMRILTKSIQTIRYVTVRVCPDELAQARVALSEIASGSPLAKLIDIVGDDQLSAGACLVESDQGVIDLSLSSQLKALRAAISESVAQSQVDESATLAPEAS